LLIPFVLESSDLQDRKEMAEIIRKFTGQSDSDEQPTPEQQAQQQAEQQAQEMAMQLQQAQIDKAKADAEVAKSTATEKNIAGMYAAVQAAQIVATVPSVVPIADSIYMSAGGSDKNEAPLISDPIQQVIDSPLEELAEPVDNQQEEAVEIPTNTSPMLPLKPLSPTQGMNAGIETARADGVIK
jgi:hypothetical protein